MEFKQFDIIVPNDGGEVIYRQIQLSRKKSYLWSYPEMGAFTRIGSENIFDSRNSTDRELCKWRLANEEELEALKSKSTLIPSLRELLTQKREAQTILDACTVGSWGTNNEPPYTEQQALKAKEAYDEAVSGIERIIDEL